MNDGAAVIVTAIETVFASVPELPVTVTEPCPGAADELAASVRTFCANDAVTPLGNPDTLSETGAEKPF